MPVTIIGNYYHLGNGPNPIGLYNQVSRNKPDSLVGILTVSKYSHFVIMK
jgi:hypothetical protein